MKNALKFDMRQRRSNLFATQIAHALQEFLPSDSQTRRRIHDFLAEMAYETNALIVNLPPEFDHLSELAAKQAMIDKMMAPITVGKP